MALRERLTGLVLIVVGLASMAVLFWMFQNRGRFFVAPPPPPGMPGTMLPIVSPLDCMMPFAALGAVATVLEGFRRLLFPDVWQRD